MSELKAKRIKLEPGTEPEPSIGKLQVCYPVAIIITEPLTISDTIVRVFSKVFLLSSGILRLRS